MRNATKENADLALLQNKPVFLSIGPTHFSLTIASEEEVQNFFREKQSNKTWVNIDWNDSESRIIAFDDMCGQGTVPAQCLALNKAYGSKAANLGFLANKDVLGRTKDKGSLSNKVIGAYHKYSYIL